MPTFKTIHTNYGLQRMAAAEAAGVSINLTEMAVGDGNGNPVTPVQTQTALARELFRATVNRVYKPDPVNQPSLYSAELVIPATVGNFTLREVGVFDADGGLFVVGNLPDTYKPQLSDGAYSDTVVRVDFIVSNADVVNIYVDPNVVVVTQSWVQNNVTAANLIPGGTTGQVLTKDSNADGDFSWHDPDVANVVVDVIEEQQTLADGQTSVILSTVTTRGLAVYIEGVRIHKGVAADEWQEDAITPDTTIILGQSYAAGTKVIATQNEPTGAVPFPLIRDQDLADVPNKALARTNLDVYSKSEAYSLAPAGLVAYFAQPTAPAMWLKCNGAAVSRTAYSNLFAAIGTLYGAGDGVSTFNLPDLRGEFIRCWDDGRGVDSGRTIGTLQYGLIASHTHTGLTDAHAGHSHTGATDAAGSHSHSGNTDVQGGHTHVAGSDVQANHSHTGTTVAAGGHSHTGTTDPAGSHSHTVPGSGKSDATGYASFAGDNVVNGTVDTSIAADHTHTFSTSAVASHTHTFVSDLAGAHSHNISVAAAGDHQHTIATTTVANHTHGVTTVVSGAHTHGVTVYAAGGAETRPRNVAMLACIRY